MLGNFKGRRLFGDKKINYKKWEFECSFDEDGEGGIIFATSTEEMGGGAGNLIVYDKASGLFLGLWAVKLKD